MADTYANVIKLIGGASETAVELVARMETNQLAVCPFEDCLIWKQSASAFIRYPNDARVIQTISDNSVEEAPIDGEYYARKDGVWATIQPSEVAVVSDDVTLQNAINAGLTVFKPASTTVVIDSDITFTSGKNYLFMNTVGYSQPTNTWWFNGVTTLDTSGAGTASVRFDGGLSVDSSLVAGGLTTVSNILLSFDMLRATSTGSGFTTDSYIEAGIIENTAVITTSNSVIYEEIRDTSVINGTSQRRLWRTPDTSTDKIFKQKGYVDPDNYNISYDPVTRTASVASKTGGRVKFYCRGTRFDFADADSKNSVVLPATERKYFLYRDDNGQLSYETVSNSDDVIRNCTLDSIINIQDDTAGSGFWIENLIIDRWEDAEANPVENFASYKTKGIQTTDNSVQFSGTLNGSTIGHTGGEYLTSRDFQFFADAVDAVSKQWVVYYLNGTDADGNFIDRHVPATLGVPYYTTGGALQYNFYNGSTWSAQPVDNQKYVCVHFSVADNNLAQVTAILGQEQYANLSTAQNNIVTERANLVGNSEVFKDARLIGSCIFQNAGGIGELQYADADNNLFSYPATSEVSTGGGSVVVPNINAVMYQDPNKGVVDISGQSAVTRILTFLKDGINQLTVWGDGKLAALVADIATLNCFESFTGTSNNTLVNADNIKAGSPTNNDAVMNVGAGVAQAEKYVIDDSNPSGGYDGDYVEDTALGALFPAEPSYKTYIQTGTDRRLRPIASFNGGPVYAYALSNEVTPTQYSVIHQVTQDPYYQTSPDPDAITGSSYDGTGVNDPYNADVVYVPAQTGESAHFEGDVVIDGGATTSQDASTNRALGAKGLLSQEGSKGSDSGGVTYATGVTEIQTDIENYTGVGIVDLSIRFSTVSAGDEVGTIDLSDRPFKSRYPSIVNISNGDVLGASIDPTTGVIRNLSGNIPDGSYRLSDSYHS